MEVAPFEWVLLGHRASSFGSFLSTLADQLPSCNTALPPTSLTDGRSPLVPWPVLPQVWRSSLALRPVPSSVVRVLLLLSRPQFSSLGNPTCVVTDGGYAA